MEITDVKIKKVEADGKLMAYVSITFDDCFVVHNLKVIKGKEGIFVAMPNRKTRNGEFKDIAHPINSEYRNILQTRILEEYNKMDDSPDSTESSAPDPEDAHTTD